MTDLDEQQTLHQIVRRIADAAVVDSPSPNIFFEDVLPAAVYAQLLAALPGDDALDFIEHADARTPDGRVTRKLLTLTDDFAERLPLKDRSFWAHLARVLTAPELTQALLDKFAPTLAQRFPDGLPELVMVPILYRDFPGYRISIHPDSASKVATLQLYLPADRSQQHLGTTFHRRSETGFDELHTNAFLPNSGYAFVRTDDSWHSVKEIGNGEAVRHSIALTLYLRGREFRSPPRPSRVDTEIEGLGLGEIGIVETPQGPLRFVARGGGWRYKSLLTKEPETIEWIDGFEPGDVLWDVGANVGIYSLYAAQRGHRVLAFEPHFANYFQLCTNIALNRLQERVTPLCLALSDAKSVGTINLAQLSFGSSMSSFGSDLDYRGRPYDIAFRQGMIGYDLDSFAADFAQAVPTHIKVDVDGIELAIARGARGLLSNPALKSISIELVDTDAAQVAGVSEIMAACGLRFIHKKQNPIYNHTATGDVLNFLFRR